MCRWTPRIGTAIAPNVGAAIGAESQEDTESRKDFDAETQKIKSYLEKVAADLMQKEIACDIRIGHGVANAAMNRNGNLAAWR